MSLKKYLIISVLLFSFCAKAQDKKALIIFEKAKKEFSERKFESATESFKKYLEKDSTKTEAYFKLGQLYETFRNVDLASKFYKKFISKDTTKLGFIQAYTYLGSRALENNRFDEAKQYFQISLLYTNKNSMVYQQIQKQLRTAEFGVVALANPLKIKPLPLPASINFKSKQYFPVLTADNSTIIFTARNDTDDENIFISKFINGDWQPPVSISPEINSPYHEGTCSISADGKIMVFTSCDGRETKGSCDLYISKKEGDAWSKPENMGININSNFWDSQPSLSSDGSKLYFSSERPGGIGKKDIWMSELDDKAKWKKAVNLGKIINTPSDDVSPFIHANGQALFFASNGKEGMGKFDIYMALLQKEGFSETMNLGYPINTSADESSLFITADGKQAFYSVDDNQTVKLYSFDMPDKLSEKINKIYYVKGFVIDNTTQKPLYASLELIDRRSGVKISKFQSDPITGDYMAILPGDGQYVLYVETPNYFFKSINFDYTNNKTSRELEISLSKIEKEKKTILENIFFDSGSAILRQDSNIELQKLKLLLVQNKTLKVEISGHTDDIGNEKINLELSNNRAKAVVNYLINEGIVKDRIIAKGFGKSQPKVKNDSEANRQLNRRIEMKIL